VANYPENLRYTAEHEWVRREGEVLRVGITGYAQQALGDIVFVTLPVAGTAVTAGEPLGEVESTKSVSDVYAPVSGRVSARNNELDSRPELINSDPYGDGWLVEIEAEDAGSIDGLLDAPAYQALVEPS
jgi:glycine cleavage system H protein